MTATESISAIDHAFESYGAYSTAPGEAALLRLVAALQDLDEVLAADAKRLTFLAVPEYHALKALLDHARSVGNSRNVVRLRSLQGRPVHSDIDQACLVSRGDCHAALLSVAAHNRIKTKRAVFTAFKQWGPVLDINPSIFNCMVKVFELLQTHGLEGSCTAYQAFFESYQHQAENDLPHYVTGVVAGKDSEQMKLLGLMTSLYLSEPADT